MTQSLQVLVVEDSADDAFLIVRELRQGGYVVHHERVETATEMAIALSQQTWDIVIADYNLPKFGARAALHLLQQRGLDLPFIIVSGCIGEETAVAVMKAGAHDYVMKDNLVRLVPVVNRELREAQERQQRRRAEQSLRENEERFRALIENALDIIAVLEADGTISDSSPSVERVLGYTPAALTGTNFFAYVHEQDLDQVRAAIAQALQEKNSKLSVEFRIQHQTGDWRSLEAIGKYFLNPSGKPSVIINARDITERKQAEATRRELEAEKERRELRAYFFSMMSHELKNPLSSILITVELLEKVSQQVIEERKNQYFERIRIAVRQMTHLLNDTLIVGKAESGKLKFKPVSVNLETFCTHLVDEMQVSTGSEQKICFTYVGPSVSVYMDTELLRHILGNLLSNGVKYSPSDTQVKFQVICSPFQDQLETLRDKLHEKQSVVPDWVVTFLIQDFGIGIPVEDQKYLFNPFHRASNVGKIPGTGLGLSIVKDCVDLHGGVLSLKSQVGLGTTFTVVLPLQVDILYDHTLRVWS